jgi:hypothetical protein
MDDASKLLTAKQYLRRKYSADLPGLKALAETIAGGAFEAVTITGNQFEGQQAQGALVFPAIMYLAAIEALIIELDPATITAPSRTFIPDFSRRAIEL